MKRSFEGLSPKMHLQRLQDWLKTPSGLKKYSCPVLFCKSCQQAFPKKAHKLGMDRYCPCSIFPTAYVTKVARQAVAYLERIK